MGEGTITVWCLLGKKAGDNTQVRALAEELGWGFVEKHITARRSELLVHFGGGATLAGIDRSRSSELAAPWPDIVISAGRRNEPVARWIRQQSGGRARLVHIGRPWAPLSAWDLVVTTPQYFLPKRANIVHNTLPLHRFTAEDLSRAERFRSQWQHLPRPWVAVLMGGDSGQFVMTPDKGRRLGALAQALATGTGGSVLASDSPRTPRAAGDAMQSQLQAPCLCYRWGGPGDNPYHGLLALADAFVVTGESMSMLGEAVHTGKPLFIFDVGDVQSWWRLPHNYTSKSLSHRLAMCIGPRRMRRDIGNIQQVLVASGRAQWLAQQAVAPAVQALRAGAQAASTPMAGDAMVRADLQRATQAVRQLVISR
ncbi:MAG: mitochondrial fission ELM1 family protein [Burkholderiaceae bacterium]|nr:mitochondrial fission ELM1 family protein [Burkholderiaceae bacterium]